MKKLSLLLSAFLIGSLLQAQNLPSYLPANGLVGWWPFNGNANDESGGGHNGIINGATLTSDRFSNANSAYSFNGSSSYIFCGNFSNLSTSTLSGLSISYWFNSSSSEGVNSDCYDLRSTNNNSYQTLLNNPSPNNVSLVRFLMPSGGCNKSSNTNYNLNQWNHIVEVNDFTTNTFRLFFNGIEINMTNNLACSQIPALINPRFNIGSRFNYIENSRCCYFSGKLDDFGLYNRALTQQEITNLYSATSTGGGSNNPYASLSWPQGISYQALARNAQGTPLLNTALQIRFSLLADSINGAVEYAESQALNSNAQGLINTAFGSGTAITGTWAGINWAKGRKLLKVELNPGTGFVNLGVQELLSVPFSQRSRSAAVLENSSLPVFSGNTAALSGGLLPGQLYRTSAGVLMVVY
jgi:hypothetical protein